MNSILKLAEQLGEQLKTEHMQLTVAESCTGGSLAAALTAIPGSSHWFERGFVTYSNHAKKEILNVSEQTLHFDGAVSEATVCAMAEGAIQNSDAHLSVAISGIAGPDGGTETKPVGTVWIAWAGLRKPTKATCYTFPGDRIAVREAAVLKALEGLLKRTKTYTPPSQDAHRYFFALWPDEPTKEALHQQAQIITKQTACTPILPENLHLTLAYLGALTTEEVSTIKQINCPIAPFELKLTETHHWPEQNITYFGPAPSEPLQKLHAFLNQHLLKQGFKPERREFIPHITLARDYTHSFDSCTLKPIHWFVHELCLVKSTPNPDTSHYETIERTPLTLKTI
ncbi:MAG: RNA 2',3'-cyclic phosphodiesterase [Gammaproteobacteria bacterium]|nr:RNA 2',3'-cyclic phosphodiesterase [Gammaproteobacteria bacterium]